SPGARARRRASGARRTSGEGWREALLFVPSIRIGSTRKRPWDGDCTAKRFHRGGRGEEETTHRGGEERVHRRGHGEEERIHRGGRRGRREAETARGEWTPSSCPCPCPSPSLFPSLFPSLSLFLFSRM